MNTVVTFRLPEKMIEEIQELIDNKIYTNKTDFFKTAVRDLLRKEKRTRKPKKQPSNSKQTKLVNQTC